MEIRRTLYSDVPRVLEIYENGRRIMRSTGNMSQWAGNYPDEAVVLDDIEKGQSYVCVENGEVVATCCYFRGVEPTYKEIYEGEWLGRGDYAVIHRISSALRGAGSFMVEHFMGISEDLRIDTHRDNIPMQGLLKKLGFSYCGIIYLEDGAERLAFEKLKE